MSTKREIILTVVSIAILAGFVFLGFRTSGNVNNGKTPTDTSSNAPASWPSAEVSQEKINEKTVNYTISAVYPKTSSDTVTMYFKSYVDDQVTQFKDDTSWVNDVKSASSNSLSLDITYKVVTSSTVQNYIFSTNSYTGGAHGMQSQKTFAFNKAGQLLTITSLFSNGSNGLPIFSTLVQKELMKRSGADAKWISDGAGPKLENYASFIVNDNSVTVLFDPYQVAPYSDGAISVDIPASAFSAIVNPEIFPALSSRVSSSR